MFDVQLSTNLVDQSDRLSVAVEWKKKVSLAHPQTGREAGSELGPQGVYRKPVTGARII
jgi:hypothetical protein